jgi:pyruvate dehydrogenase E2 component (dihydrolipoamide acetyltransferase)
MATEVILPRVDMDMTTGRIARWYVEEGAAVEKGQPLFEIETDKAAMEIEAPETGVLRKLPLEEGGAIAVGSTVGWICRPDEPLHPPAAAVVPAPPPAPVPPQAVPAQGMAPAQLETAAVVLNGSSHGAIAATPLARRLAAQHRITLAEVPGSGPRRRIQARDVEQAVKAAPAPGPLASVPAAAARSASSRLNRRWLRAGEGRPLVLIHGFGGELNGWRPLVASLQPNRPVLAIDLPGHGASPALAAPSLTGLAETMAEALAEEQLGAIDLIAHSLGAAVATELADTAPLDIRSLFLMAPAGLGPEINGDFLAGFCRARSEESLGPWLRLLVADAAALTTAFVRATARLRQDEALSRAQSALAQALFPDGTQAFSIRPALERLGMPIRVVFGTDDRIIPAHHAALVPGLVAVHRLRGIGHMPYLENQTLLARILSHHLAGGGD